MRKDAEATRTKILDAANELILEYGYGGTTVDEVIAKAGLTKGAFFYHFKTKDDLARALVDRYAAEDSAHLETAVKLVESQSSDPVQQLLDLLGTFVDFFKKSLDDIPKGCLYASYCYEAGLLEPQTVQPVRDMMFRWRDVFSRKIRAAIAAQPPRIPVDPDVMADQVLVVIEGAYILARTMKDRSVMVQQFQQLQAFVALAFGREGA